MTVPRNVLRFEVLLYLSILLDVLSSAFLDHEQLAGLGAAAAARVNVIAIIILAALCGLVHVAARKRMNWARWVLLGVQALSVLSSLHAHGLGELTFGLAVDLSSTALTVAGLYFSFTGDARGWFDA